MMNKRTRKSIPGFLLALILTSLIAPVASADGMVIPFTLDLGYIQVDYHRVNVTIDGPMALTHVEQRFSNPYAEVVEGRYVFPLPPGAAIRNFEVTLDGISQTIHKLNGKETEIYIKDAILNQQDPSLLQFLGWETYAVNLSLPPFGSTTMKLDYEELILPQGGLYRYFYTLSTERYSSGPLEEVSIEVDLLADKGIANVYSTGHPIHLEQVSSRHTRVTYEAEYVLPTENFELYYSLTDQPFDANLLTYAGPELRGEGHFLFFFSPSSNVTVENTTPKDIIFVIDRSGSMAGEKIQQAKQALQFILGQLEEQDRFAIISFDDLIESQAEELQVVTNETIQRARSYMNSLFDRGSTDIEAALRRGQEMLRTSQDREGATKTIVFLTDGLPTAGVEDDSTIADLVSMRNENIAASIHVFGVGYDVNTHLLDRIAAENHGQVTYVQPGESLEIALASFYSKIAHPLLTDISLNFEGFKVEDVLPSQLPDLFLGSSLAVTGRYSDMVSDDISVQVEGQIAGKPWREVYHFTLSESQNKPFIARLWATRRIGELLDRVRVEGETDRMVEEIKALGLRYGVVTPYTIDILEAQVTGAASEANMRLYYQDLDGDGLPDINKVSGEATVGARAQNLAYQQTAQANMAVGANVVQAGEKNLAQVGSYAYDLSLIDDFEMDLSLFFDETWLSKHADRIIRFASTEYFELAKDPKANQLLQAGPNVVFEYKGKIIAVQVDIVPVQPTSPDKGSGFWDWLWLSLKTLFNLK